MEKNLKTAAVYIKTTDSDDMSISSIIEQLNNIESYLIRNNIIVKKEYYIDDGCGENIFERSEFKRLFKDVENKKIDLIVMDKSSRIGRDFTASPFYELIKKHKIDFVFANETFDMNQNRQLLYEITKVFDEYYKKQQVAKRRQKKNQIR